MFGSEYVLGLEVKPERLPLTGMYACELAGEADRGLWLAISDLM